MCPLVGQIKNLARTILLRQLFERAAVFFLTLAMLATLYAHRYKKWRFWVLLGVALR
jgi:hypothetical protein